MSLRRPFTLQLYAEGDNNTFSTKEVIEGLKDVVSVEDVKCVTQTGKNLWQLTFGDETARDTVLARGLDLLGVHYTCHTITGERHQTATAFIDVKMPYEMPDGAVRSLLSSYGPVVKVHRRTYSFAPTIETGVRIFTVTEPKSPFPRSVRVGRYVLPLYVRYAGQPPRCYRCGSDQHQIRECPKPPSFRRCYTCGSEDHLYQHCPVNINRSNADANAAEENAVNRAEAMADETETETEQTDAETVHVASKTCQAHSGDTAASDMESDEWEVAGKPQRKTERKKRGRQPSPADETPRVNNPKGKPKSVKKKREEQEQSEAPA